MIWWNATGGLQGWLILHSNVEARRLLFTKKIFVIFFFFKFKRMSFQTSCSGVKQVSHNLHSVCCLMMQFCMIEHTCGKLSAVTLHTSHGALKICAFSELKILCWCSVNKPELSWLLFLFLMWPQTASNHTANLQCMIHIWHQRVRTVQKTSNL